MGSCWGVHSRSFVSRDLAWGERNFLHRRFFLFEHLQPEVKMILTLPFLIQETCFRLLRAMIEGRWVQDHSYFVGNTDMNTRSDRSWKLLAFSSEVTFPCVISLGQRTKEANWQDGRNE